MLEFIRNLHTSIKPPALLVLTNHLYFSILGTTYTLLSILVSQLEDHDLRKRSSTHTQAHEKKKHWKKSNNLINIKLGEHQYLGESRVWEGLMDQRWATMKENGKVRPSSRCSFYGGNPQARQTPSMLNPNPHIQRPVHELALTPLWGLPVKPIKLI